MSQEQTILDLIYRAHRRLAELENTPREYVPGEALHSSDIHTVAAVARREGCNLTELAAAQAISVPAAFKFAARMVKEGYLEKRPKPDNAKEVAFFLTAKGHEAARRHDEFRQQAFGPLARLEGELPSADRQTILKFLRDVDGACTW